MSYPAGKASDDMSDKSHTISVDLTWLHVQSGIAVANVRIAAFAHGKARGYSAKMLIGPDGHYMLESRLFDGVSIGPDGMRAHALHPCGESDVIQAARDAWRKERAEIRRSCSGARSDS